MIPHIIGFLGMLCVVICYYNVTHDKWKHDDLVYNGVNLVGAILLIISLCFHFNLGSFVIEVFWIAISISALWRKYKGTK